MSKDIRRPCRRPMDDAHWATREACVDDDTWCLSDEAVASPVERIEDGCVGPPIRLSLGLLTEGRILEAP